MFLTKIETLCSTEHRLVGDIKYPQQAHIIEKSLRRIKSGTAYPPHRLIEQVLEPIVEYCEEFPAKKVALLFAAGNQGWPGNSGRYDLNPDTELYYKLKLPMVNLTNIYAGRLASMVKAHDFVSTDASACASSLHVLMEVQHLLALYGFDRVVVVSGEDSVTNSSLELFGEIGASLQEGDPKLPSAFDATNGGFYLGQGAVAAVFENDPNIEPIAKFLGAYSSSERNTNTLSQCENGTGYVKAIETLLELCSIKKNEVHLVKTHGTGTPVNDAAEKTALSNTLHEFVATSYKPAIGHTMGVSGLLETGLLLDDLKRGVVPAIPNRTESDTVFLSSPTSPPDGPLLSLAAGMGNIYSAALFDWRV